MPPLVTKVVLSTAYEKTPFYVKPVVAMLTSGINKVSKKNPSCFSTVLIRCVRVSWILASRR